MIKRILLCTAIAALASSCLFADFGYEQTTKMTGGILKSMAFLSKQLREPIRSTVSVKGNRMSMISSVSGHIIDLDSETITEINFQKKTYSVMTFAQMAEALKAMQAKAKSRKGDEGQVQMSIKPSVKETGQTREINGVQTHEVVLTMEFEGTNPETNQSGTMMTMVSDMWMAPDVPGYAEVRDFHRRMAEKLNWVPGMTMMGGQDSSKGMAEMYKELSKMSGVPVLQLTKMGMAGAMPQGDQAAAGAQGAQTEQQPQPQPQPQVEPEKPSLGGALGRLGGRFGGLGGMGRKKKDQTQDQTTGSGSQGQAPGGPGSLMEMTSELSGFSSAPIEASKFQVPAGFKQVDSQMLKATQGR
jgi:hypothetical protein